MSGADSGLEGVKDVDRDPLSLRYRPFGSPCGSFADVLPGLSTSGRGKSRPYKDRGGVRGGMDGMTPASCRGAMNCARAPRRGWTSPVQ